MMESVVLGRYKIFMRSAKRLGATEKICVVGVLIAIPATQFSLEFVMKVGDLVKLRNNQRWVGVITRQDISRFGTLNLIDWSDGTKGACWNTEIEVMK